MGTVFPRQSDNMKLIAVLALAAVAFAEPEADPKADPWYTWGGYTGYPYAGVYGGYRTYGAYPYSYGLYGKRSAEAEPEAEADPWYTYGGYGHAYGGLYGGYRTYGAYPYSYGYYGKRSAEAEAEADPALLYTSVAGGLVSPVVSSLYTHPVASPVAKTVVAAPAVAKTVVSSPVTYTVPHVAYPGVIYGKRSAEAEADPPSSTP